MTMEIIRSCEDVTDNVIIIRNREDNDSLMTMVLCNDEDI